MLVELILLVAILVSICAYVNYYKDIRNDKIAPNRWSWLIWSATTAVEALTYDAVSSDLMKAAIFFVSAISCFILTIQIWHKAKWQKPNWAEITSVVSAMVSVILWQFFQLTLWAHLLVVFAVPIAFVPTWMNAWKNPEEENSSAWGLWTLSDLFTLVVIISRLDHVEELPYIIVEFSCHLGVWGLVRWGWSCR
jgi:hypothetical protein